MPGIISHAGNPVAIGKICKEAGSQ